MKNLRNVLSNQVLLMIMIKIIFQHGGLENLPFLYLYVYSEKLNETRIKLFWFSYFSSIA